MQKINEAIPETENQHQTVFLTEAKAAVNGAVDHLITLETETIPNIQIKSESCINKMETKIDEVAKEMHEINMNLSVRRTSARVAVGTLTVVGIFLSMLWTVMRVFPGLFTP